MYELQAVALRVNEGIEVSIAGRLPDTCWSAEVVDFFPGGQVTYASDPEHAQVFVATRRHEGNYMCLTYLVPWSKSVIIAGADQRTVQILLNGEVKQTVSVKEVGDTFIVIAPIQADAGALVGCSIIPPDAPYIMTHRKVFGPEARSECDRWVQENCRPVTT